MRLKEICDYISRGTTPDYVDESPYKVMNQATFSKGWLDENNVRYTSKNVREAQIKKGDLLMASTGGGVLGKVFFFDSDNTSFYADSHVSILRNSKGGNLMKYLYYVFSIKYDEINATMVKGSTNQTELQRNYLLAYELDMPPLSKQQRIVDYLDEKLGNIDARIAVLEKQQNAYARLKKSIIHHAVTCGLNPNVSLKDSGVDWIGMIPEHWEVKRIKDVFNVVCGATPKDLPIFWDGNILWITPADMSDLGELEKGARTITEKGYESCGTNIVPEYSIIMSTRAPIGKTNLALNKMCTNQGCKCLTSKKQNMRFMLYFIWNCKEKFQALGKGTTFIELSTKDLSLFVFAYPPLSEQQVIADYLDEKCSKIDAIIENISKQINALKRLKRALINEVVTGQRNVERVEM